MPMRSAGWFKSKLGHGLQHLRRNRRMNLKAIIHDEKSHGSVLRMRR